MSAGFPPYDLEKATGIVRLFVCIFAFLLESIQLKKHLCFMGSLRTTTEPSDRTLITYSCPSSKGLEATTWVSNKNNFETLM